MRKKIILLFLIIFLTGCDAVYNLNITSDGIDESSNIYASESDIIVTNGYPDGTHDPLPSLEELVDEYYNDNYLVSNSNALKENLYNKEKINDENGVGISLSYSYNFSTLKYSSLLSYCFNDVSIDNDKNNFILSLKDASPCYTEDGYDRLDSVSIRIKSDLKMVENNADRIEDDMYIWDIDKSNAFDSDVYLKLRLNNKTATINRVKKTSVQIIPIILFIILGITTIIFIIRRKNQKNNEI